MKLHPGPWEINVSHVQHQIPDIVYVDYGRLFFTTE